MHKQLSGTPHITAFENDAMVVVEAYKKLRANLLFALASSPKKVILVSSPEPNTGKSTTCGNLAVMMAQTGSRVLLIDADLRKPTLHRIFHVPKSEGLTQYLINLCDWEECVKKDVAPNVDLITSGPIPPNPSELLGSARMVKFLEKVSERYDYVFIDTPPVNVVTDGLVLAARAAGVMLLSRYNSTTYDELQEAIDSVKNVHGNLLGVIINDYQYTTGEKQRRYYKRRYGYGYANDKETPTEN